MVPTPEDRAVNRSKYGDGGNLDRFTIDGDIQPPQRIHFGDCKQDSGTCCLLFLQKVVVGQRCFRNGVYRCL